MPNSHTTEAATKDAAYPLNTDAVTVTVLPTSEPRQTNTAYFTFKNVSYTVDVPMSEKCPDGKLKILNKVSGFATPGMMIALIGTSGAGKTTLLDVSLNSKSTACTRCFGGVFTSRIETLIAPRVTR